MGRTIKVVLLAIAACAMLATPRLASAAPIVNANGVMTGYTDVNVAGTLYDVAFVDGTCVALFNGCDSASDFDFNTPLSASLAAQALVGQVFGSGDSYDAGPFLTFGCTYPDFCVIFIPYTGSAGVFNGAAAQNNAGTVPDFVTNGGGGSTGDFRNIPYYVFADFSPAASTLTSVPEPASLLLLGSGLGVAARARYRRKE